MLQLNRIRKEPGATHKRKRLGRGAGSGHGMTSGKGDKGQLARSGGRVRPGFEGGQSPLYRRLPKVGFNASMRRAVAAVNLHQLNKLVAAGTTEVSLETLLKANVIKGNFDRLSILSMGEAPKGLNVKAFKVSAAAKEKIEKAGGKIELLAVPGVAKHTLARKNKGKKA